MDNISMICLIVSQLINTKFDKVKTISHGDSQKQIRHTHLTYETHRNVNNFLQQICDWQSEIICLLPVLQAYADIMLCM